MRVDISIFVVEWCGWNWMLKKCCISTSRLASKPTSIMLHACSSFSCLTLPHIRTSAVDVRLDRCGSFGPEWQYQVHEATSQNEMIRAKAVKSLAALSSASSISRSRRGRATNPGADVVLSGLHGLSPRGSLIGNASASTVGSGILS